MSASPILYVYYPPENDDSYPGVPNRNITEYDWSTFTFSQRRTIEDAFTGQSRRKVWLHRDQVTETEAERAAREEAERLARDEFNRTNSVVRYGQIEHMIDQLDDLPGTVRPLVTEALSEDGTIRDAATQAVDAELAGKDILEGGDILEDEIVFAVVDEDGRRTWLEAGTDGGLTDHAVSKIGEHITGAVEADMGADDLSFAVVDENDRRTWIEADAEGKPTVRSLSLIGEGLGTISTSTLAAFPIDDWAHWGDSLTAGAGGTPFPAQMAVLTGKNHYNGGWGGQVTNQIASRQGGTPARITLSGNAIPASGSVALTGITRSPLADGGSRTGTIAGVPGTLSLAGSTHTFTRSDTGDAVMVTPSSYFTPTDGETSRDRHVTIWTGRNGFKWEEHRQIAASIQAMIDYLAPVVKRVIVMEIPPSTLDTSGELAQLAALNTLLEATFPQYWLPIATWLRTPAAATAAGITFTADDTADIAAGVTPRSLRSDELHFSANGNKAIAYRVHQEAQMRGWL